MDSRVLDINAAYWGVPLRTLMENAGKSVAQRCTGFFKIAVFCGRGNNGGDGLVAARYLIGSGADVTVFAMDGARSSINQGNLGLLPKEKVRMIGGAQDFSLQGFDLIVDALIGVGFSGPLREPLKGIIEKINQSDARKLSVDAPSAGMVEADEVVSFHTAKVPGAFVADIGIPDEAEFYCGPGDVVEAIPERKGTSHKGDFGRLIVLGGSREYVGTPALVAQAALRAGVDLVTVCVPQYVADKMPFDPNLIVHPLKSADKITVDDVKEVLGMKSSAFVFGNGAGGECQEAVEYFLKNVGRPTVVDADALSLAKPEWLSEKLVVTPHEGEFRKLFGSLGDREKDTFMRAKETGSVVVLKGALDVVSDGKIARVNETGNPYMTVGGTGDVLAGVIGGLLAQRGDRMLSACAGVFLSGLAGDLAAKEYGVSLVATDVIGKIPQAIRECMGYAEGP
jgi:ADP-dependent NAD(P)H-hydrate dehydratase / NAD(P)H-hydrate epimerase